MAGSGLNHYRAGAGDPLVLVHGLGSSWRAWVAVLSALAAERDVLALDLPGFGGSPPLAAGVRPTVRALADAVEHELDAAGFESAHLVGNSLGGWISLDLARRGRARTVVAISPAGLCSPSERERVVAQARTAYATARLLAPFATVPMAAPWNLLLSEVYGRPWRVASREAASALLVLAESISFLETLEWTVERHRATGLDEIRCPVLIAWGTKDRVLAPGQAQRFLALVQGAELCELAGLGHLPMTDDPELVARMILEFTRRRGRAASSATLPMSG